MTDRAVVTVVYVVDQLSEKLADETHDKKCINRFSRSPSP